jgi:redox-sensitive bicupin YhaK (pirin superfamily)
MNGQTPRRNFLTRSLLLLASSVTLPAVSLFANKGKNEETEPTVSDIKELGFQWETRDPFLFCVHHEDNFPNGNASMGPEPRFYKGRQIGDDFIVKDGFRMYHGKTVPGFPGHPHRGFETVTVVRKGIVDHADSMGAAGRYGNGDVQWMTAGKGVQHSEMFPLIHADKENPMELFQIWLNLPRAGKMVEPHFKMLWRESIPNVVETDSHGKKTNIEVIAGAIGKRKAPAPPPDSWAANPANEVAIWNFKMQPGATITLPKASVGVNRTLYFYEGAEIDIDDTKLTKYHSASVVADRAVKIKAGADGASILILQGRPIGEPVIQYGPFVMNTKQEINQAFEDYHSTKFGGWPWPKYDQVHARERPRFAKFADGTYEEKKA